MPKSSMQSRTPVPRSCVRAAIAAAPLPISMLSVSSSRRREGSMRQRASISFSSVQNSGCSSCRPDRLTERVIRSGSVESALQASSSTQCPSGTTRPVSSASGMNSLGGTSPRSRCSQRTSASTPRILLLESSTIGW